MKRPALRYFGGKYLLAPWIISHFPEHRVYVEPYGGAASVLLRKPRAYAEVWNDVDDTLWNLFFVFRNPDLANDLMLLLKNTPYSRREFELAHGDHPHPIEKARRTIIRSFMGFGGESATNLDSKTGFRSNSNRSGSTPAHDWVNYPQAIPEMVERLKGVVLENRDAISVMKTHDHPETLHYLDPPYPTDIRRGNRYSHEMTIEDHEELADFVRTLKGNVVISGYTHPIYERLEWRKVERAARSDRAGARIECLWMNFPVEVPIVPLF